MQFRFDGHQFPAASFLFRLQAQCWPLSRLAADGQTRREPRQRSVRPCAFAWLSWHETICQHLEESPACADDGAVFITLIETPQCPAAAVVEILQTAVLRACRSLRDDGVTAVCRDLPDRPHMTPAPVGGLHKAPLDQAFCRLNRTEAEGPAIGREQRDLVGGFHF